MKNWYKNLKVEYQVVIWSTLCLFVITAGLIPCFIYGYMDVPLGIALGMGINIIVYLFLGICYNKDNPKKSLFVTVMLLILRLLIIGGVAFLAGWLYYKMDIKIFNIFGVVGGYIVPIIINLIIVLVRKEK